MLRARSPRAAAAGIDVNAVAISSVIKTLLLEEIGKDGGVNSVYSAPVGIDEGDIGQARRYDLCLGAMPGFRQLCPDNTQKFDVFFSTFFDQRKLVHLA